MKRPDRMSHFPVPAGVNQGPEIDRRALLALAGGGVALAWMGVAPTLARAQGPGVPRYVVTDRRYAGSVAFGQALVARGSMRLEVADGLTRLWREALAPLWRSPAGEVAGLTSREVWTCLTEQARGQGRRSVLLEPAAAGTSPTLVSWVIV